MRVGATWRGGSLRRLQKPYQTALGILARLNVPGGTVADEEEEEDDDDDGGGDDDDDDDEEESRHM